MNERAISVSELNGYIKRMMDTDLFLSGVWIKGEISNFKNHTSGHLYMTLKDEGGAVRAVMFKSSALKLKFIPEDGMKVLVFGRVSVFESAGQYQVYIEAMQPDGVGALYIAFEQLKEKLEKEGLFSEQHKKALPRFPEKIGVITSPTGAAIRDILNVLNRRFDFAKVIICPVLVQGEGAAEQIANAIRYANENSLADLLIVGRGGGSIEDLWAFNEEVCARAIYDSEIPIISAVGHETDFTIADFVADMRAPTPSAAAEIAVPSKNEILVYVSSCVNRMLFALDADVKRKRQNLTICSDKLSPEGIVRSLDQKRLIIDNKIKTIQGITERRLSGSKERFSKNAAMLYTLNPLAVIGRGYTVTRNQEGVSVKKISDVKCGDKITSVLTDGTICSLVMEIQKGED